MHVMPQLDTTTGSSSDRLLHEGRKAKTRAKRFWQGFADFALQDNVLEVAVGLMYVVFFSFLLVGFGFWMRGVCVVVMLSGFGLDFDFDFDFLDGFCAPFVYVYISGPFLEIVVVVVVFIVVVINLVGESSRGPLTLTSPLVCLHW